MINYNNSICRSVTNSANGETSGDTVFLYKQTGNILTAEYSGGNIKYGHLIGLVDGDGTIDMRYHQVNQQGTDDGNLPFKTGNYEERKKLSP
jgi:hypothetical protein